jgi:NADH-quinone oxidoreductase subunit C
MFMDLCAVDYLSRDPRFEIAINVVLVEHNARLRVLVGVPGEDPALPSITRVYPGANFYEREAFDLFGVDFVGHPDMTRILLPDEWEGHPLRKDFSVGSVPVQFKGANKSR